MAIATFDNDNNTISILLEKSDLVYIKEDKVIEISNGGKFLSGKIFVNGEHKICIIRGERQ